MYCGTERFDLKLRCKTALPDGRTAHAAQLRGTRERERGDSGELTASCLALTLVLRRGGTKSPLLFPLPQLREGGGRARAPCRAPGPLWRTQQVRGEAPVPG